ncbi:RNA polymerase sigma factor [Curvibacter gracilis]|uniref:RNA polymerase sigma factor n=1 Tax=Curvibacter gracilis TaxID=230310 RepID=UPI0004B7FFD7|nr:sigma factor [Curvibacter gracilis]
MEAAAERSNLIVAAWTGDPAAITRLLAVCQADARRYARRHCQACDVDDAVQESLLVISRKVKGLKAAAAFSSWLFTVIRRECRKLERMMFRIESLMRRSLVAQLTRSNALHIRGSSAPKHQ